MNPRKRSVCFSAATVRASDLFSSTLQREAKIEQDYSIAMPYFLARHFSKLTHKNQLGTF